MVSGLAWAGVKLEKPETICWLVSSTKTTCLTGLGDLALAGGAAGVTCALDGVGSAAGVCSITLRCLRLTVRVTSKVCAMPVHWLANQSFIWVLVRTVRVVSRPCPLSVCQKNPQLL